MTFPEYQRVYLEIKSTMGGKIKEIGQTNLERLRDWAVRCY